MIYLYDGNWLKVILAGIYDIDFGVGTEIKSDAKGGHKWFELLGFASLNPTYVTEIDNYFKKFK